MFRGSIDSVTQDSVEGWVYCDRFPIEGTTILAYIGDRCIGHGAIDIFRDDLKAAGLGDGVSGFQIPISIETTEQKKVFVQLEGSDFLLMQRGRRPADDDEIRSEFTAWLVKQRWISKSQQELFLSLESSGAVDIAMPFAGRQSPSGPAQLRKVSTFTRSILSLLMLRETELNITEYQAFDELCRALSRLQPLTRVVAIWSPNPSRLGIIEGSHHFRATENLSGALDYRFGGDRILLLNPACQLEQRSTNVNDRLILFADAEMCERLT